ncbi:MAG TPA: ABC transporter substrate-binding protein [Xanthobacteraceae bacterium]|nr:ABC transporter substrate-binding protein [Xanthobacteraceae bacterium]
MKRRDFIMLVGGAAAAWPLTAKAQQTAIPVVGFLSSGWSDAYAPMVDAFRQGLREFGYIEGQNVAIEYRWAEGRNDRLTAMAADLVQRNVSVIVGTSTPGALAAKAATKTIPIVFEIGGDPVELGLVTTLNRPGTNLTGVTQLNSAVAPKRLELLHQILPAATKFSLLVNPTNPAITETESGKLLSAARTLGLEIEVLNAKDESDFEAIFAKLNQSHSSGLVINTDVLLDSRSKQLASLAKRHAVPAVGSWYEFPEAGGLASYGSDLKVSYQLTGGYVGRILKGDSPAILPVQQATKLELIINVRTAKALGLTVPLPLLGLADQVIE